MSRRAIQHVTTNYAADPASARFYRSALLALGHEEHVDDHGRVSFGPDGDFGFYEQQERFFEAPHVAFEAPNRAAVDRFHEAALAAGGRSVDAPRERPEFGPSFYSTYLTDAAGTLVEALHRDAAIEALAADGS